MEINVIDKTTIGNVVSKAARNEATSAPPPRAEKTRENTEAARPAPPRRPPPPVNTVVTQSLDEAGISTAAPTVAVPGVDDAKATATDNDPSTGQNEKVAQALQAFMHSLVQATNPQNSASGVSAPPQSVAQTNPQADAPPPPATPAAAAYGGLVSRLEGLVQAINGDQSSAQGNEELARLDSAFRDLVNASGSGSESGTKPELQTVLKSMIRNLQSTGDPTLASTGNVINTAA
jgi:hypothetical protein